MQGLHVIASLLPGFTVRRGVRGRRRARARAAGAAHPIQLHGRPWQWAAAYRDTCVRLLCLWYYIGKGRIGCLAESRLFVQLLSIFEIL